VPILFFMTPFNRSTQRGTDLHVTETIIASNTDYFESWI
jgi:hypothetical protein